MILRSLTHSHNLLRTYSQSQTHSLTHSLTRRQCRGELYDTIKAHIDMHRERDFDGRTALTLLINMETTEVTTPSNDPPLDNPF